jgi:hypothetical protein
MKRVLTAIWNFLVMWGDEINAYRQYQAKHHYHYY